MLDSSFCLGFPLDNNYTQGAFRWLRMMPSGQAQSERPGDACCTQSTVAGKRFSGATSTSGSSSGVREKRTYEALFRRTGRCRIAQYPIERHLRPSPLLRGDELLVGDARHE